MGVAGLGYFDSDTDIRRHCLQIHVLKDTEAYMDADNNAIHLLFPLCSALY